MTFAVQPTAWKSFDQWGCLWAISIEHAQRLAASLGEPATIWQCPTKGNAIALMWAS